MFCDLSEAICDVTARVAEVAANQPNQQRHIISLTYAAESWAALRASVADTYISQALSPSLPASFPSVSLCLFYKHSLLLLSNHRWCYYFYQSNKVAWSQRTVGSGEGKKCSPRSKTQTCYFCYACPQRKGPWGWKWRVGARAAAAVQAMVRQTLNLEDRWKESAWSWVSMKKIWVQIRVVWCRLGKKSWTFEKSKKEGRLWCTE